MNKADILIIGAGYTGLSAAIPLLETNLKVVIIDANEIGGGASGKNTGFLVCEPLRNYEYLKNQDDKLSNYFIKLPLTCIEHIKDIVQKYKIDCDLKNSGSIKIALKDSQFKDFERLKNSYEKVFQVNQFEILTKEELLNETIFSNAKSGFLNNLSYRINPHKYLQGLVKIVRNLGGIIQENSQVDSIDFKNNAYVAKLSDGKEILANEIILATDSYKDKNLSSVQNIFFNVETFVLQTEPLPAYIQSLISSNERIYYTASKLSNYFKIDNNCLYFGGKNGLINTNDKFEYSKLHEKLLYHFPILLPYVIQKSWKGNIGCTLQRSPFVGKKEIYYSLGYSGRGIGQASYYGYNLAKKILNLEYDELIFKNKPTLFNYIHKLPLFMNVASHYIKFLDRFF